MRKTIGRVLTVAAISGAMVFAFGAAASASDYVYTGSWSDGQGGYIFHYENAEGQSIYAERWLGLVHQDGDTLIP